MYEPYEQVSCAVYDRGMRRALLVWLVACGDNNRGPTDAAPDVPNGTRIQVTLSTPSPAATYAFIAAYQDGDAPWQPTPPPDGENYVFYVQSDADLGWNP